MTRKQIDAAREARLWIAQVVVPVIGFGALYLSDPYRRAKAKAVAQDSVNKVKSIFKKKGDS